MGARLEQFLSRQIEMAGPMDVGTFISHVLCHPKYGYYTRQDPLGSMGDFTTAPEVSQMFGELIGAWLGDIWGQMGKPEAFILLEGGPGRGTLMADILRSTKGIDGFHDALQVHFLENSPHLKKMQKQMIAPVKAHWHDTLESVPDDRPIIMVANELLDALPFRQVEKTKDGWMERVVCLVKGVGSNPQGKGMKGALLKIVPNLAPVEEGEVSAPVFKYGLREFPSILMDVIPKRFHKAKVGSVFEFSLAREGFIQSVCARLKTQGGAGLFIDYGDAKSKLGNSFHAINKHKHVGVFTQVGDADLSSNVDFGALKKCTKNKGVHVSDIVEQGAFLMQLGLAQRAQALGGRQGVNDEQRDIIKREVERLASPEEMGTLFKVMGIASDKNISMAGFDK